MQRFDDWMAKSTVAVRGNYTRLLMQAAYNAALRAASEVAQREFTANTGSGVVPCTGDAAALKIKNRIDAFMDKKALAL